MQHVAEPNFIGTLGLNWKLFLAQIINFGIVVLILWKWVFKPVAGALENRRQKIEESVKRADEIERRMREFRHEYQEQMREARAEAAKVILEATTQAEGLRDESVQAARTEATKILAEARESIQAEKDKLLLEVRQELASLVVMATERVIKIKLDQERDRELIESVVAKIK